jgi:hypothetical protein
MGIVIEIKLLKSDMEVYREYQPLTVLARDINLSPLAIIFDHVTREICLNPKRW